MSKKVEKEQATALRKRGFSYKEIAKYVNVSVSTISLWCKDEPWSKNVTLQNQKRAARDNSKRISLLNKARSNQNERLYAESERSAVTEYKHYKHNPLFIAGISLYFSIGDQTSSNLLRLSTSRIEAHSIFIRFLIEYLGVSREKVRFWLALSPVHDSKLTSMAWSKALGVPLSQFHKHQLIRGKSSKRVLQYGVGNTIIGNAVTKRKLTTWIELMLKELK